MAQDIDLVALTILTVLHCLCYPAQTGDSIIWSAPSRSIDASDV